VSKLQDYLIAIRQIMVALLAWIIVLPLTFFVRRDPRLIIVIGREGGLFTDNAKHFFVFAASQPDVKNHIFFLSTEHKVYQEINKVNNQSLLYPRLKTFWFLLRSGVIVADTADWFDYGVYQLTRGAKLVQIWHGAPLKEIELSLYRRRLAGLSLLQRLLIISHKHLIGRYIKYDIVVATSQKFIKDVFQQCFMAKKFVATGYPRNDILFYLPKPNSLSYTLSMINVDTSVLEEIRKAKKNGMVVCLYAPTFRKTQQDHFVENNMNLSSLSALASKLNILFILKLHPIMSGCYQIDHYPNLLEYSSTADVYPAMAICDLLMTDYSSIFFDFLLLDRPIIFFSYDLEDYLREDRCMYFDYDKMTPGVKCYSYEEVEQNILSIVANNYNDGYENTREQVKNYTHDHVDANASQRLLNLITTI
jgi:CDP-glycerol glycerophosphotransferase (TagB/SpsB family)